MTCEGNAGFYERGSTASAPLRADYSVLMWNHPGFGCSTGKPWPREEAAAIDVVFQFALTQLGWKERDIVIYAWSIGGFSGTWAAMNYDHIRGLVLDATFDDTVPLAQHMLSIAPASIIERGIRSYLNLDIRRQLAQYDGPVVMIRRLRDEVMAFVEHVPDEPSLRKVNRINYLFKSLLRERYPNVFRRDEVHEVVDDWLAASEDERELIYAKYEMVPAECRVILENYVNERQEHMPPEASVFPLLIGVNLELPVRQAMALYLASRYMIEVDMTHGKSLPTEKFVVPHHPWE